MKNIILALAFVTFSFNCFAKDLTHRLGIGFKNNTIQDIPSLSGIYYSTPDLAITAGLGIDTKKDYSSSQIMVGARYIIYPETNMNFYGSGQMALLNAENPIDGKKNGVELAGLFGVEFFFTGLENLGLSFEAGVAMSTINNSRFRTVGDSPFRAGFIFYF